MCRSHFPHCTFVLSIRKFARFSEYEERKCFTLVKSKPCVFWVALVYRVTLVVAYLGWVDLDLGSSTILLGQ